MFDYFIVSHVLTSEHKLRPDNTALWNSPVMTFDFKWGLSEPKFKPKTTGCLRNGLWLKYNG